MANKMLIDASQPEETRVVVLRGNRVEEFDFEAASRKQLRGNIYLAKVTRVEPSLQAAFVEYGGNRHGFLAFAEIHPDYYQIPVADRLALLEEEARAQAAENDDERPAQRHSRRNRTSEGGDRAEKRRASGDAIVSEPAGEAEDLGEGVPAGAEPDIDASEMLHGEARLEEAHHSEAAPQHHEHHEAEAPYSGVEEAHDTDRSSHIEEVGGRSGEDIVAHANEDANAESSEAIDDTQDSAESGDGPDASASAQEQNRRGRHRRDRNGRGGKDRGPREHRNSEHRASGHRNSENKASGEESGEDGEPDPVEQLGGDALEEVPYRNPRMRRQYKIQEVIKRRQVLLVQVVKEERGNKGAALTTYLSLAGRYSVLMPNTARGGGISRKITDSTDRKRLKEIVQDLEVPEGMGIILRTAGAARTKPEVKRDFEYLLRMWETVRELTLKSSAPMLVYEEGSLIKRSIRDLYNKEIDEVIVAGEEGYREAHDFMQLLMPSHARNVKYYTDAQPIFTKAGAEAQLDAMFSNQVTLKSGGYIVINQTEALVAIDVNSGRSTREHNIEDTAVRTNLEAADEVARQLRLRDLAGLIVVDFIDMDEGRNNRSVERRMKDALANDRARIQVGRISHFGLLEMSRQRIRTGVLEGSTVMCAHCAGAGMVRATSSIALHVLRVLEDSMIKNAAYNLIVRTRMEVALYILNQKRMHLSDLERRFGVSVTVAADETLTGSIYHAIERGEPVELPAGGLPRLETVRIDSFAPPDEIAAEDEPVWADDEQPAQQEPAPAGQERKPRSEARGDRHKRGQRQREPRAHGENAPLREQSSRGPEDDQERGPELAPDRNGDESEATRRKRRRRRRRGGGADREIVQSFAPGAPQPYDDNVETGDAGQDAIAQDMGGDAAAHQPGMMAQPDYGTAETGSADSEAEAVAPVDKPARRSRRAGGQAAANQAAAPIAEAIEPAKPAKRPRRTAKPKAGSDETVASAEAPVAFMFASEAQPQAAAAVAQSHAPEPAAIEATAAEPEPVAMAKPEPIPDAPAGPKRSGWWQRAKAAISNS